MVWFLNTFLFSEVAMSQAQEGVRQSLNPVDPEGAHLTSDHNLSN